MQDASMSNPSIGMKPERWKENASVRNYPSTCVPNRTSLSWKCRHGHHADCAALNCEDTCHATGYDADKDVWPSAWLSLLLHR